MLRHYGLDPDDPDSWLYLVDGQVYTSLDAVVRVGERLGGWGRLLQIFRVFSKPLQGWLYNRLARNRYRFFGKKDMCLIEDKGFRSRLIK